MFPEAKDCYTLELQGNPAAKHDPAFWNNFGNIFRRAGLMDEAVSAYGRSAKLESDNAYYFANYGQALSQAGRKADAIVVLEQTMSLNPSLAPARALLADLLSQFGRFEAAVEHLSIILREGFEKNSDSKFDVDISQRHAAGMKIQAEETASQATLTTKQRRKIDQLFDVSLPETAVGDEFNIERVRLLDNAAMYMQELGKTYAKWEHNEQSAVWFWRSFQLRPSGQCLNDYANIITIIGSREVSVELYRMSVELDPRCPECFNNLANILSKMDRVDDAIAAYEAAVQLRPRYTAARMSLGKGYREKNRLYDSLAQFDTILAYEPSNEEAFCQRMQTRIPLALWDDFEDEVNRVERFVKLQLRTNDLSCLPPLLALQVNRPLSPNTVKQISRSYVQFATNATEKERWVPFEHAIRPHPLGRRLKLGFASSDFMQHTVGVDMQNAMGMFDREKIELFCFATTPSDSGVTRLALSENCEHFIDVSEDKSHGRIAKVIHGYHLDILINLNGHTKGAFTEVFVLQPAPLQIQYKGFSGTVGADSIPHVITDRIMSPPDMRQHYTETLIYAGSTAFLADHRQYPKSSGDLVRGTVGLPESGIVYCNFNRVSKLDPTTFAVWMRILERVDNSVLWLAMYPAEAGVGLRAEFAKYGLDDSRLILTGWLDADIHLAAKSLCDVFLDTPLHNAHAIATDVLWSGVPIVTLSMTGHMSARIASSLVTAAGLPEMVVGSLEEYEETAVSLGENSLSRYDLRARLLAGRYISDLFDTEKTVIGLENGILLAWDYFSSQQRTAHHIIVRQR